MRPILTLALAAGLSSVHAQYTTETYNLEPGWNGIFTLNDAGHTTLDTLLAAQPSITQIWRWEPSNLTSQFIGDPTQTVAGQKWKAWCRGVGVRVTVRPAALRLVTRVFCGVPRVPKSRLPPELSTTSTGAT